MQKKLFRTSIRLALISVCLVGMEQAKADMWDCVCWDKQHHQLGGGQIFSSCDACISHCKILKGFYTFNCQKMTSGSSDSVEEK